MTEATLLHTTSMRHQIAESLRASVITGEMEIGTVYSVPTIAEQFGVSITPVREAMLDLANEGLVEPVRNKGFRVRELSAAELDEILQVRLMLEPAAAAQAAGKASPQEIKKLRALADAIVDAAKAQDLIGYVNSDREFHRFLLELTRNETLTRTVLTLRDQSRLLGLRHLATQGLLADTTHEHHDMIDAIETGDAQRASAIVSAHLGHVRTEWA
jgi:DNA-binding GntR family transcriptional regulator